MFGMKGLQAPLSLGRHYVDQKWDGKTYMLLKDLVYVTKRGKVHRVPEGFITDCASWIRRRGRFEEAAVIHDYLYASKAPRAYSDQIFKEVMTRAGCPRWRINLMYYGVRIFGWYAYHFGGTNHGE